MHYFDIYREKKSQKKSVFLKTFSMLCSLGPLKNYYIELLNFILNEQELDFDLHCLCT